MWYRIRKWFRPSQTSAGMSLRKLSLLNDICQNLGWSGPSNIKLNWYGLSSFTASPCLLTLSPLKLIKFMLVLLFVTVYIHVYVQMLYTQERLNFDNEVADIERAISMRRHNLKQLQVMKDEAEHARDKARVGFGKKWVKNGLRDDNCTCRECCSTKKRSVTRTRRRETRSSPSTEKKRKKRRSLQTVSIAG